MPLSKPPTSGKPSGRFFNGSNVNSITETYKPVNDTTIGVYAQLPTESSKIVTTTEGTE